MTTKINESGNYSFYGMGDFQVDFNAGYVKAITHFKKSGFKDDRFEVVYYDKDLDFAVLKVLR